MLSVSTVASSPAHVGDILGAAPAAKANSPTLTQMIELPVPGTLELEAYRLSIPLPGERMDGRLEAMMVLLQELMDKVHAI